MGLFSRKQEPQQQQPVMREEFIQPKVEEFVEEVKQEVAQPEVTQKQIVNTFTDEMGIIAGGTIVHGDVKTKGHVAIVGVVEGNVIASGNVMLTGVVKGNIECNNIIVDGTDYSQCIRAKGSVSIKQNTTISGPIYCKHISISGTIIGSIRAMGNVGLTKDAIIKGDITSSILAVEPGAKIAGNLLIK